MTSRIARNLGVWSIPMRLAIWMIAIPLPALPVAVYLAVTNEGWFYWLTDEDALVEWIQIGALLLACGAYVVLSRRHWRADNRVTAILSILVAVGVVAIIGEELSWGQRIFGWATPPGLESINDQGESNIHNIGSIASISRLMQFAAVGYGVLVPMLALLARAPTRLTESYFVPPIALPAFFVGPFLYWVVRILTDPPPAILRVSEIMELSSYLGLAALGWLSLRRLNIEASHQGRADRMSGGTQFGTH